MKYGSCKPSRLSRGNKVHAPRMFAQPTQARICMPSPPSPPSSIVMGSKGRSTLFSCTWKENKKKPQAQLARAKGKSSRRGNKDMVMQAGRMETIVAERETRWVMLGG